MAWDIISRLVAVVNGVARVRHNGGSAELRLESDASEWAFITFVVDGVSVFDFGANDVQWAVARYPTTGGVETAFEVERDTGNFGVYGNVYSGGVLLVKTDDSRLSDARPPTSHNHDDRYYTETEVDGLIGGRQAADADLAAIAALTPANDDVIQRKSGNWVTRTLAQLKADLALVAPNDMSIVAFGKDTTRAAGTGDNPFGIKIQRNTVFTSVTFRVVVADASGNGVYKIQKNGVDVSGMTATVAFGSQVAGGTATGTWNFAAGDILTLVCVSNGGTPGKGLMADIKGTASVA